jgi:hypothetical protein
MCDRVGANASTTWFPDDDDDLAHPSPSVSEQSPSTSPFPRSHHSSCTLQLISALYRAGIPSLDQAPQAPQAPSRYSFEPGARTARHGTHVSPGQLPPLEPRRSSPVTLPSFNTLESFIRRGSPPPPPHLTTRHAQNSPVSFGPLLKPWKSENMVIDQSSASSTLAGQQLNIPAPSLPTGYPGYAHSFRFPHSFPSYLPSRFVLIQYSGCVSFSVIPNASRALSLRSSNLLL